jgi:hypothetical protein
VTRSEAIRIALVEAAARLEDKRALAAEVAALEADEADRAETALVADLKSACVRRGDVFALAPSEGRRPRAVRAAFRCCRTVRYIPASFRGTGGPHIHECETRIVQTGDRS